MTEPREHSLAASDDTKIFVRDWPIETARAGVVLMHGLGEHSGRYAHVARFFNQQGYAVRAYDHRGHGRSEGRRGDLPAIDALIADARLVVEDYARELDAPPLLVGHSMGGLYAAYYATRGVSPLSGLILSSPALAIRLSGAQRLLLRLLEAIAPGFGVANGLDVRYLSHRQDVIDAYVGDPLVHRKVSARLLKSMLAAVEYCQTQAPSLSTRTLLLVAEEDRLVDARGSAAFHAKLASGIGTLRTYPGFYHEIFNEAEAERVFQDVRAWLRDLS